MLVNSNDISTVKQTCLLNQPIIDGTSALKLDVVIARPVDQEVFPATPWRTGNTGTTKKQNFNSSFQMLYRVVFTDRKLRDFQNGPVKKVEKTQCLCGGQGSTMGRPETAADPDPVAQTTAAEENKLAVFSNLASVQAARKEKSSLNIAYDCEYQSIGLKHRIILSYQFAVYIKDAEILEVVFITKRYKEDNRLYLRTCLGAILDLLRLQFEFEYLNYAYALTRRYNLGMESPYFFGSDERYRTVKQFRSLEEAEQFSVEDNPLLVIDKNNIRKSNDFGDYRKCAMDITLVCHAGSVDLSAFKDDVFGFKKKNGHIMPYLKSIQGGMSSIYPYFTNVPSAAEYWKFYPVNILFRDTMCFAPAGGKSLAVLGNCVNVPKIKLPDGAISSMQLYLENNKDDFLAYAAQDALVTIMYGSRLWGINKEWCLTATSGSAYAMKQNIAEYMKIPKDKHGKTDKTEFDRIYRGYKEVKKDKVSTPVGLIQTKAEEPISYEAGQLHRFAANAYCGGYNTCSVPGVYEGIHTFDFDLENAYPTAMCLVFDIDWDNPIEREFKNEDLSLQAFHTPMDPMFCLIDFEFPSPVKYPCIAIHNGGSIIFPRKAQAVYASGPSMYLALKLGAKIHIRYGYVARILFNGIGPSMSLRAACRQMVSDREIAKKTYGKGSVEELLIKLFVNGIYGKIAQNVIEKHTWDGWRQQMDDIGCSSITSPERAALITDIVRCMLIGTMNQLSDRGLRTFSVTTDGFITEASLDDVNACDCYGFRKYFEDSRLWLTGNDPTIWAEKHDQYTLINPTTRCNVGFGGKKGVLAHGGFVTGLKKDTKADAIKMAETILRRTGRVTYKTLEFVNQKEMVTTGCDFYAFEQKKSIRLDFDFKRKPIRASFQAASGNIEGVDYEYMNFDTEPFDTIEEYEEFRRINENFNCLRTNTEWQRFWLRLEDHKNSYKRNLSNLEWSKLFSVIQGYRMGLWDLPEITACSSVVEKLSVINKHNWSGKTFNENAWKNSRKPERASQMLPPEFLKDVLEDFGFVDTGISNLHIKYQTAD